MDVVLFIYTFQRLVYFNLITGAKVFHLGKNHLSKRLLKIEKKWKPRK